MENRFGLKSFDIAFEIPFLNLEVSSDIEKLSSDITESYLPYFDVLSSELKLGELGSGNQVLLYHLITRVDLELTNESEFKSEWDELESKLEKFLSDFLANRNLEYRIIKSIKNEL